MRADSIMSSITQITADPLALFDVCLRFVAGNVEHLESLVDFPDIIGKKLFEEVGIEEKLKSLSEQSFKTLSLFIEAYPGDVLPKLCASNHKDFVIHSVKHMPSFYSHIQSLDLSHCYIGMENTALQVLASLRSLSELSLCDNCLTNDSLQKLTAPTRMFSVGLSDLQFLDLSCNPFLMDKALRYLVCLVNLKEINLSGTDISVEGTQNLCDKINLRAVTDQSESSIPKVETAGWAKNVTENWMRQASIDTDTREDRKTDVMSMTLKSRPLNFYKKSARRQVTRGRIRKCPPPVPVLRLVKVEPSATGNSHPEIMESKYHHPGNHSYRTYTNSCKSTPTHVRTNSSNGSKANIRPTLKLPSADFEDIIKLYK